MVLGGVLSAVAHMMAFIFKSSYIAVRRFAMDPANKNTIWNLQAFTMLCLLILCFLWLVGIYQDLFLGIREPVFFRAIPLLIPCFLGHIIYSCPALFKNSYSKPLIQTFLNALSILAAGQLLMKFVPIKVGLLISIMLLVSTVSITLYYTLHLSIKKTTWNKLNKVVEEIEIQEKQLDIPKESTKESDHKVSELNLETIDLNEKGCLSHLRYYSEDCIRELFHTVPTKDRQSELMTLNRNDRPQHSQYIGGTGAGKTLLATNLITQDLLNDYIGSTIIEPKGSLIRRLANFNDRIGRPYYRLDPEYEFSDCFNPLYVTEGGDIEPMIEANVSAFHAYLGPDAVQYFKSRATNLLRVGIKALKYAYGNEVTFNELDRLVQPLNDDYRSEVLHELRMKGKDNMVPLLKEYTRNMAGSQKTQEHTMQTYSNLYDYLSELTSNRHIQKIFCGPSTFNIDDVLDNGKVVLVNGAYGTLQTLTYTVGRLFLNMFRASTFRREVKNDMRPHQLTVDEIEMFADEEFSTFMEMAREFELYVDVIHQGNEQLEDVSKRLGSMVKQNAVQKFILAGLEVEDAKYYADMISEEYKISVSSGTDEMATAGFKTQLKEEKRYTILPKEILHLKGYNPETGDYGECLFRRVHNNVREEPVIGMILPLSRRLFAPLVSREIEGSLEETMLEKETLDESETKTKIENAKDMVLERVKRDAQERKVNSEANEDSNTERIKKDKISGNDHQTRRNSIWDMPSDNNELESEEERPENKVHDSDDVVVFTPATVSQQVQDIAKKLRNDANLARENKERD